MKIQLSIDTEASGPCPGLGEMISFGAVIIEPSLSRRFRSANIKAECPNFQQGAYDSIGITRAEHESYTTTLREAMLEFDAWLTGQAPQRNSDGPTPSRANRFVMVTDNPAFDFMWMTHAYWTTLGYTRLGHSARRIGDMWSGIKGREFETQGWKKLRDTKHTHDPLDDSVGNAEAYLKLWKYR